MKISVNLATRPFVELRPLFARLRIAVIALSLLAAGLTFWLHALTEKARAAEAQMNALKAKTLQYQQERQQNEARMRQPQNRAVLERSQFLNALFAQKSFSWTAVMMDLERVLPAGVQVTSIEPATTKSGEVNIRLRVSGERDRAVQLVRNLEQSQRFVAPRLAGEAAQVQETGHASASPVAPAAPGAVEFDILSGYNPLPPVPAKAIKDTSSAKADADGQQGSDEPRTVSRRARGAKAAPSQQQAMKGGVR
jgi:type IV pilus assembly protein PilN